MQVILNLKTDLMDCVPGSVGHVAADAAVVAAVDLGRVSAFSGSEIQSLVDCFCLLSNCVEMGREHSNRKYVFLNFSQFT